MKPLIVILLAVVWAEAQSLVDVARQERARQAQVESRRIFTSENTRGTAVTPPTAPVADAGTQPSSQPATPAAATPNPTAPATTAAATAAVDPAKKFADDVARLRTRLRELQDQDASLQIQMNDLNTKFFAPVTDQASKEQAQVQIAVVQRQLATLRVDLAATRSQLQQMEAQGPPAVR